MNKSSYLLGINFRSYAFLLMLLTSVLCSSESWSVEQIHPEKRFALLIANGSYPDADYSLKSAINDAYQLKSELQKTGFTVDLRENATLDTMRDAVLSLENQVGSGDVALIYFSGFGIQASHRNYLIPVKAQIWADADVRLQGINVDDVLSELNRRGATIKIAIIDAAYPNPYERRFRAVPAGLAPINTPDGSLAILSAGPGKTIDESTGANSLFMGELTKELRQQATSAEEVFIHTRIAVSRASNGEQLPWVVSSLAADFQFFAPGAAAAVKQQDVVDVAPSAATDRSIDACDRLAASPFDISRPSGISGVQADQIEQTEALRACREAHQVQPDNIRVTFELARVLGQAGNAEAGPLYRTAADAGLSVAMNNLGVLYEHGNAGMNRDTMEALRWYQKAAQAGLNIAMNNLAHMYADGVGIGKDENKALGYYRESAAKGDNFAMFRVGVFYDEGIAVDQDRDEAVRWFRKSAEAGNPFGMYKMGFAYQNGIGIYRDATEAIGFYEESAKLGNANAMNSIGRSYELGDGVPKDYAMAAQWYRKAADRENPIAMNNLGTVYENGRGVDLDESAAIDWYRKSAEAGNVDGMKNLSRMYSFGIGTPADAVEASKWADKAASSKAKTDSASSKP